MMLSDKDEGEFAADGEARLMRMAWMVSIALENARLYRQVAEAHARAEALGRQLLEVQEAERRALARELHDEFGQLLTGLRLLLAPGRARTGIAAATDAERALGLVDELLARVRGLSLDLRPAALDQLGLLPALLTLFERYTDRTGVRVEFRHEGIEGRLDPGIETTAYRIVQEALTNVARHAGVDAATVRVRAADGVLGLQVADRGRGFDPGASPSRSRSGGLDGMRERARLAGGRLTIESRPGGGARLTAELPLPDRPAESSDAHLHRPG
jgi:signal transduction histidine kinase